MSRYFTTPIYYVNDRPHIGHLYTTLVTDTLTRFHRLQGEDVRFLTGTDEHGQKIEKVAKKEGVAPIDVADRHAPTFRDLWKRFEVANDDFIRTTEPRHRVGVTELIRRLEAAGDLYVAGHEGWYCVGCEAFYPEKDLEDGKCPTHGTPPEWQKEENVFFRLSKYQEPLLALYEKGSVPGIPFVFPETRLNEVRSFVAAGLKDLSVSRTAIQWGIPFPGHPGHVVYVWLDALTNYLTALGLGSGDESLVSRYWPAGDERRVVHLVGKDILRFHAVYWPAFLMSAGLPLPTQVVSHGFWLKDARKMSKSVGNVVRPDALVDAFGVDALRWHLVSEMSFGQDASFSDEAFLVRYNSDLANGLGNTLSRAVRMAADAFGGKTPSERCDDNEVKRAAEAAVAAWDAAFRSCRLHEAAEAVRVLLGAIDGYITAKEPWKKVKAEGVTPALHRVHHNALEGLRVAACLLAPIAPGAAAEVLARLGAPKAAEAIGPSDLAWGGLPLGAPLAPAAPLFPRADAKAYFAEPSKEKPVTEETKPAAPAAAPIPPEAPAASPAPVPAPAATPAAPAETPRITVDDFFKADLRVAEIVAAEKVEKSKKLMKMTVRIGEEERTIVAGIATAYTGDQLVGRKVVVVANLLPAKLMGIESNGMVLAASLPGTGEPSLLAVDPSVPSGTKVK
ncbi:MAG TPA: methionine--tRNA ligase [Thermoanaerobaculia bacterium]|jgi:methionyl-tRNA synthetase|nr:methionine--tRNA ligase [Thermoanaerobaculia bacterium]HQN08176.1 methionine--tRNA ligase [Thermoanaerobaculia bacterium]